MNDSAEKAVPVKASQKDFNAKLHFLRVKAHQEMVLEPKWRTINIPRMSAERMMKISFPQNNQPRFRAPDNSGCLKTIEFRRGSVYFDMEAPSCPCCGEELDGAATSESVILPLNRDDWKDVYSRPDYIHQRSQAAGIPVRKLRTMKIGKLQDIVWILHPKDRACYVVRRKDITGKGGLRPGAQTPLHLPYVPNEIYDLAGDKIGQFSEEQALAKIGQGPQVQPGRLQTVSYLETDLDEEYNQWDSQDYNGPMVSAQ